MSRNKPGRAERRIRRRNYGRQRRDPILIVCEGATTEPTYLGQLAKFLGLEEGRDIIIEHGGSSPATVYKHARELYEDEKRKLGNPKPYRKVFCVFDKDQHAKYEEALDQIQRASPQNMFNAITSVPCFEYWLLLHFRYTTAAYTKTGRTSACQNLIKDLRTHFHGYGKNMPATRYAAELMPKLEQAVEWSKRASQQAENSGTDNPSTRMHELVDCLKRMKEERTSSE